MKAKRKESLEQSKEILDWSTCPLNFPDLTPLDYKNQCTKFAAALDSDTCSLTANEVDPLQVDLETLLTSVVKRMKFLETELKILDDLEEENVVICENVEIVQTPKNKGKLKGKGGGLVGASGKRKIGGDKSNKTSLTESCDTPKTRSSENGKGLAVNGHGHNTDDDDETPPKKFKDSSSASGGGKNVSGKAIKETPKTPKRRVAMVKVLDYPPSPVLKPQASVKLAFDAPSRLWAMVEPFCGEITADKLKVLEDLMKTHHEDKDEYYKVPPLGERHKENGSTDKNKKPSSAIKPDPESSPFGPLTQRLIQALVEEHGVDPLDDDAEISENAASISPKLLAKQLNIGNTAALERRIRLQLEENGILDPDDSIDEETEDVVEDSKDEVLMELEKVQQELKEVSQQGYETVEFLYKQALKEMDWQDVHRKVLTADEEVYDAYKRLQLARASKSPTKKDMENAKKMIKEREKLVRQLDAMTKDSEMCSD